MNPNLLDKIVCPDCLQPGLLLTVLHARGESVEEGQLRCASCRSWHRIENGVADLLPADLKRPELNEPFRRRHGLEEVGRAAAGHPEKIGQISAFGRDVGAYEATVAHNSFYRALDEVEVDSWAEAHLRSGQLALDVGCGTGRQMLSPARRGVRMIGLDICEEMLGAARRKLRALSLEDRADLICCDVERMPLRDAVADGAIAAGTLHHVPDPARVIQEISRRLRPGGVFFSLDPNDSPVRFLFDWAMRLWRLYEDRAPDDVHLSAAMLRDMLAQAAIQGNIRYSTFLLPHLAQFFAHQTNVRMLRTTNRLFAPIPLLNRMAGVIVAEGVRL